MKMTMTTKRREGEGEKEDDEEDDEDDEDDNKVEDVVGIEGENVVRMADGIGGKPGAVTRR
jgi:hypothetical protein